MAKVILGSACIDENGRARNGKAGNQTGKELKFQNYYLHAKGWYRLRAFDYATRQKIADAMEKAVNNKNIGYDQNQRLTLFNLAKGVGYDPSKVTTPCETDCSALVRVCLAYAGINVGNFTTANERNVLMATNKFSCQAITKESECMRGDILVTKVQQHTVVVTQGYTTEQKPTTTTAESDKKTESPISIYYTVKAGDTLSKIAKTYGTTVADIQKKNPNLITNINKIKVGWKLKIF